MFFTSIRVSLCHSETSPSKKCSKCPQQQLSKPTWRSHRTSSVAGPKPTHQKLTNLDPTRPNPIQPMGQPNPWTTLTDSSHATCVCNGRGSVHPSVCPADWSQQRRACSWFLLLRSGASGRYRSIIAAGAADSVMSRTEVRGSTPTCRINRYCTYTLNQLLTTFENVPKIVPWVGGRGPHTYSNKHRLMNIFLYKAVFNWGREQMSPGSKGIRGVWKARTGNKRVETMMPELDKLKEFTMCSIDEFRDEVRVAKTTILRCKEVGHAITESVYLCIHIRGSETRPQLAGRRYVRHQPMRLMPPRYWHLITSVPLGHVHWSDFPPRHYWAYSSLHGQENAHFLCQTVANRKIATL